MAETKLTMSLDDLIAQSQKKRERKPKQQRQSGGQPPQTGPRKGLRRNRGKANASGNGAFPQPAPKQPPQQKQPQLQQLQPQRQSQGQQGGQRNRKGGAPNLSVRSGQVQKRSVIEVPAKLIRQPAQALPPPRQRQAQPPRQPASDGKWEHDLYNEGYVPPRRAPVAQVVAASSTKLIITNLHHQVSEDDLLELFSIYGTVKSRMINYDSSGRSLGTGVVVFETRAEAEAAKKEYDGVKLDGQPMEITFGDAISSGASLTKLSSGISVQKPGAGGAGGGGAGRSGGAGKGGSGGQRLAAAAIRETAAASRGAGGRGANRDGRLRSAVVGRAQLDADLQDYMQE